MSTPPLLGKNILLAADTLSLTSNRQDFGQSKTYLTRVLVILHCLSFQLVAHPAALIADYRHQPGGFELAVITNLNCCEN